MSFILDALKKSELERQRAAMPGLVEAPVAQRRSRLPTWAWIVGALLLVNVAVLGALLWRSQRPPAEPLRATASPGPAPRVAHTAAAPVAAAPPVEAPAATVSGTVARSAEPPGASAAASSADHFSPMDAAPAATPVYAPEIPVDDTPARAAPRAVPPLAAGSARATRRADPTLDETPAEKADNDEVLPTISQVNLQGAPGLSDIHLDVHVYATRPADRFVYVNMRKYREGATLQEGPLLERIRRDGVILNYRGVRFLLPRQ